jgi:LacI family transcriptional regulator
VTRLKDIAKHAGVSVMTVSKALRDEHDVSAATKTRIKQLAQQLGYVPDSTAQGLRTRATKLLGLAISSLTSPVSSRVALAIEERAHEMGFDVLLAQTLDKPEREEACLRRFLSRRVEGLFVAPVYRMGAESRIYQEITARGIPTVLLGHPAPFCSQFLSVAGDDLLASYAATQHLLKLGHKHIAFMGGPSASPWGQERFEGYRRALREAGLDVEDKLVFQAGRTIEDGANAALQLINESSEATAVQAVTDLLAVGCIEELLRQGLKVPGDISVVGFGNILLSRHFKVTLTTLRQPKFRLGAAAMDVMQQLLLGKRAEAKRLPAELMVRESSGTPPALFPLRHLKTKSAE